MERRPSHRLRPIATINDLTSVASTIMPAIAMTRPSPRAARNTSHSATSAGATTAPNVMPISEARITTVNTQLGIGGESSPGLPAGS